MRRFTAAAIALAGSMCAPSAGGEVPAGEPLRFVFEVNWDGATRDGDAYVFSTNLGYTVGVRALYLAVDGVELVPCETATAPLWSMATARADHVWNSDSSYLAIGAVERLSEPSVWIAGTSVASGAAYCDLFWASSPIDADAPDGFVLSRASIHLEGWFRAPEGETVDLAHEIPHGEGALLPVVFGPGERVVRLTRYPARSFDDLELADLSPSDVLFGVLQRLGNTAEVTTELAE
ncbi:MAG: hypothetical protein AAGE52_39665 [Myxococcota bacterium]